MMSGSKREAKFGYIFASPWLIGFLVFMLYPLVASIYFSLCDYSVLKAPIFIGLDNYKALWGDEVFWIALKNTVVYSIIALPAGMASALILAMLLNAKVKGMTVYRTIFFIPSLVPQVHHVPERSAGTLHLLLHRILVRQCVPVPQDGICQRHGMDHVRDHPRPHFRFDQVQ